MDFTIISAAIAATSTATTTATATTPIGLGTIFSFLAALSTFLGAGTLGWGLAGGAALLIGILYFIFKSQINDWLIAMAAAATNAANQAAAAAAAAKAAAQEAEMQRLQAQLDAFATSEKKNMLDALSLAQLESYATQAYGSVAVNAIIANSSSSMMPALQIRVGIYQLYGLGSTGATGIQGVTGVQP